MIERGFIDGEPPLYASFYRATNPVQCALLLPAFGDERRCTHRYLCRLARQLAERGCHVLQVDLSATGDSLGVERETSMEVWQADACRAWSLLAEECPNLSRTVIGLRLGANLALEVPAPQHLLIAPLLSGRALLDGLIRRKQIKEMSGTGTATTTAAEVYAAWKSRQAVDLDGIWVSPQLASDLEGLALHTQLVKRSRGIVHVLHLGPKPGRELAALEGTVASTGGSLTCVAERPIWGRLDCYAAERLTDAVRERLGASSAVDERKV